MMDLCAGMPGYTAVIAYLHIISYIGQTSSFSKNTIWNRKSYMLNEFFPLIVSKFASTMLFESIFYSFG